MNAADDPVLAVAVRAARSAASVISDAARDLVRLPTFSKDHGDIVSTADVEAEDAIVSTLRSAFPGHAILGEESGHIAGARDGGGYKWIVDPIDGTVNFIHGFPYYAVSIALVHGTESRTPSSTTRCTTTASPRSAARARIATARRCACRRARTSRKRWSAPCFPRGRIQNLRPTCRRSITWSASAPDCAARARAHWTWRTWPRAAWTASG